MDLSALVVCPDQDSSVLLTLIQSEMDMTVEHTSSISRGLEMIERNRYDAIVFDYHADESSEEFLARLRHSSKNRGSMLIAVVDSEFNARLVFVLGASFVLYRPISSDRTRISLRAARSLIGRDRRIAPRTPVGTKINVAYAGAPEMDALLANLSEGGTAIHTPNRIPTTSKIYFEFALPGQKQLVRLSGEVAWQDVNGRTGIRFLNVPQASRRLMQSWLEENGSVKTTKKVTDALATESTGSASSAEPKAPAALSFTATPRSRSLPSKGNDVSDAGNRRNVRRFPCKLGAEVFTVGAVVPNRCTLSDISENGCYVEMPSPLSGQTGVEILVRTADTKFKIKGEVLSLHPGFGMGVRFLLRESSERKEIMRLLGALSLGPSIKDL